MEMKSEQEEKKEEKECIEKNKQGWGRKKTNEEQNKQRYRETGRQAGGGRG